MAIVNRLLSSSAKLGAIMLVLMALLAPTAAISDPVSTDSAPAVSQPAPAVPSSPTASQPPADVSKSKPKSKLRWLSALFRNASDDQNGDGKLTQEELVQAAQDYNKHRQYIEDYPIDEFIITPGGGGR